MKHFHIGIRIDDIVCVTRSTDKDFPTSYTLRNGHRVTTMGEWDNNVAAIEKALLSNLDEARSPLRGVSQFDIQDMRDWLSGQKAYMVRSERDALRRLLQAIDDARSR